MTVGKLADIVILDVDLRRTPPESMKEARVSYTIVGGTVVFQADNVKSDDR